MRFIFLSLQIYKQYLDLVFTILLPLAGLVFFNLRVFVRVRQSRQSSTASRVSDSSSSATELTLARVLLTIVTTFLVCQIPRIFLAFYRVGLVPTAKFYLKSPRH